MATRDVRDIMGLPVGENVPKSAIAKRPKPAGQPRQKGINRELIALHGERAPPVSIIDSGKQYRAKFQRDFRPAHWESIPFSNSARTDGLQLRHWRKQRIPRPPPTADGEDVENSDPQSNGEKEYEFAKFNVQVSVPTYTDEQYDLYLKNERWSKEETDYLMDLVKEYYQRWPIIIDRYEWKPSKTEGADDDSMVETAIARTSDVQPRDLEDLKARYYQVWAQCLELAAGGEKNMSESEFALHETLSKYNPKAEKTRKGLAWQLAKRPAEEAREEEFLLSELQRIMISAQKFETERHEVRERLEMAQPINGGSNMYTSGSSAALNSLYASLAAQDRTRKARHRLSINVNDLAATPAGPGSALPTGTPATATAAGHRESVSGSASRKGTVANIQTPVRTLSPRRELRFGITSHDRLQSGVTFRSDKLLKLRQAKSQSQTLKIAAALSELQVPEVLVLPTQRVCDAFEGLISRIGKLVEARKVLEKEEGELRVKAAIKDEVNKEDGGAGDADAKRDKDAEMAEADAEADAEAENDEEKADNDEDNDDDAEAEVDDDAEGEEEAEGDEQADVEEDGDADGDGEVEDADADGEADEDDDDEAQNEAVDLVTGSPETTRPPSSRSNAPSVGMRSSRKRSASIMSAASSKASRTSKRTRK